MKTLKQLLASDVSVATPGEMAVRRGIVGSYSVREFEIQSFPISVHPEDEPIGCNCTLTLFRHGAWTLEGNIRNTSDLASYDFTLRVLVLGAKAALVIPYAGTVGANEKMEISVRGNDLSIRALWSDAVAGQVETRLTTELGGLFGGLVEILKDLAEYLILLPFAGGPVAAVIVLGRDVATELDVPPILPNWPVGIVAAGGMLIIGSPLGAFTLIVAGHAADVLRAFEMRPLSTAEANLARAVFGDSLQLDRIRITNAGGDRAKCIPTLDGFSLINVGTGRYPDMMGNKTTRMTLVHELVHCWQALYCLSQPWNASRAWDGLVHAITDDQMKYVPEGELYTAMKPWEDINFETQAALIATWYDLYTDDRSPLPNSANAMSHPIHRYLERDIRPKRP